VATLSTNRIAWQYHADDGKIYRVAAVKALTDQGVQGGEAWAGVVGAKPANIKMRRITVRDPVSKTSRVIPLYDTSATIIPAGQTINLNLLGTETSFVSSGNPIPQGHIRTSVTEQST